MGSFIKLGVPRVYFYRRGFVKRDARFVECGEQDDRLIFSHESKNQFNKLFNIFQQENFYLNDL